LSFVTIFFQNHPKNPGDEWNLQGAYNMDKMNEEHQKQATELTPMAKRLAAKFGRNVDMEEAEGVALMAVCTAVLAYSPDHKLSLESFVELSVKNTLKHWKRDTLAERKRGLSGGAPMISTIADSASYGHHVDRSDDADRGGCSRDLGHSLGVIDTSPEEAVYWEELLGTLPKDLRPLAHDKWLLKKTQSEIAKEQGLSEYQVSVRIKRAEHYAKFYLDGGSK
jgi:RNA polymerase sigma factor (sigma-70 family)